MNLLSHLDPVTRKALASVNQTQDVEQQNVNQQVAAIAIAFGSNDATAVQASAQTNDNEQAVLANATNIVNSNKGAKDKNAKDKDITKKSVSMDERKRQSKGPDSAEHKMSDLSSILPKSLDELKSKFNIGLTINHNGGNFEIGANEEGEVSFQEKSETDSTEAGTFKVVLNQGEEKLEIEADPDGNVYMNGNKVE
ncbi:hypothetical protein [Salinibacillus xinjiangensis]|uniref:Uncharacterized protein n=1 Tax=Salinibacillus xinjiangensis TaxID=1229268 RepID=A0A6G1XB69_9BACI|nr:hypothetical protein [Salinibacillus xinjiangensis]MRG88187.1 hypothetical protein [Salinibacillus xinjiangensis]